jgi:serine protease inhibitor
MMRLPFLALCCLVVATISAHAQQTRPNPTENDARELAAAIDRFGAELAARAAADGNLCQSPASIALCLSMTLPGARGATAAELQKLLCPPGWDSQRALGAAHTLLSHLRGTKTIELSVVNDLWPQAGHPVVPEFLAATKDAFDTEVRPQDFSKDPMAARKVINDYVARATRQRITDLLPPDAVGPQTRLVLTNALYLKADWRDQFKGSDTHPGTFHLADGTDTTVPMMHRRGQYALAEVNGLQVLRMPYVDGDFAFDIALPAKDKPLAAAETALAPEGVAGWMAAVKVQTVDVTLPRFRVEGSYSLIDHLRAMGLVQATSASSADFGGIDGGAGKLFLSEVVHKTFLDVAERGTEAAAATAAGMDAGGKPRPVTSFTADRPFAFALRDLATGLVLFSGRVADPRSHKL